MTTQLNVLVAFLDEVLEQMKGVTDLLRALNKLLGKQALAADESKRVREIIAEILAHSSWAAERAEALGLQGFLSNNQPIARFTRFGQQLANSADAHLGRLEPLIQMANQLGTDVSQIQATVRTVRSFLTPVKAMPDLPPTTEYALLIDTGLSDAAPTIGDLKSFSRDWEVVTSAYGMLFGRSARHGRLIRLEQGSIICGIELDGATIVMILAVAKAAFDAVKSWLDLKTQRLRLEQEARERNVPTPALDDWSEAAEKRIEEDFLRIASELVERKLQETPVNSQSREGVQQANTTIFKYVKNGAKIDGHLPSVAPPPGTVSLTKELRRAQGEVIERRSTLQAMEYLPAQKTSASEGDTDGTQKAD